VVMTDDQDVRSMRVMSTVKRQLAGRGTTFEDFFATFPLCCPSRVTYFTGQYAHNHGVVANSGPNGGYQAFDDAGTLAPQMKRAGYSTAYIGKYLNGYGGRGSSPREVPRGWTDWRGLVDGGYYRYQLNENGQIRSYGDSPSDYQTDVLADKAGSFIRRAARRARPFFLTLATQAPHTAAREAPPPAPRHRGRFRDAPLPTPPSFNERDVSDKPSFVRRRGLIDGELRQRLTKRYRGRLGSLLAVDDAVEKIVGQLRRSGEYRDTVIIYTSDNGYLQGEHRLTRKTYLYEESAGVPLMIRGPRIPVGATRSQVTGNIDLAPTILDLANATPGRVMDGRSLVPLARDPSAAAGRDILLENRDSTAVRTRRLMYAEHGQEEELYDLERDPFQLESRHDDPAYTAEEAQLAQRLHQLEDCRGSACR
jgi:N-acetylglucosamine-6-sulfatase